MSTIQDELKGATLGPEYSYIVERPSILGRSIKKLFEIYCRAIFTLYCPLKVRGRENLPESPFIFCSNHSSHMDSPILMISSGRGFKNFGMMAAKDYFFDNPTRKYFLNLLMNLIPIDRSASRQSMIEYLVACREFTKNGNRNLIVYPEGTRSRTGRIQPFKKGPATIATEVGLPIVPVYIKGTHRAWPKGRSWIRPARIRVIIGKPIYPEPFLVNGHGKKDTHFTAYRGITEELEKRVHELMEQNRNGEHD